MVTQEAQKTQQAHRPRKNRLLTDALREVWKTRNRFFSLFLLCALAVAFLSGLRTTAPDMKYTADRYFDAQKLMDVRVLSTQGLTEDDLEALAALDGVASVEGARSFDAICGERILGVMSVPRKVNLLSLKRGRLPQWENECVAEQSFLDTVGLDLGGRITLDLDASGHEGDLSGNTFTVVGVADSPMYISVDRGSSSLGTGRVNAALFVPEEAFTLDYYTAAYLTLDGLGELACYSDEYEDRVDAFLDANEEFARERADLRFASIRGEAQAEVDDARREYDEAKADAERELEDARQKLEDARRELDDGWAALQDGREELRRRNLAAEAELRAAYIQIQEVIQQHHEAAEQYEQAAEEMEAKRQEIGEQRAALLEQQEQLRVQWDALREQWEELEARQAELDAARAELEQGLAQYEAALSAYPPDSMEYQIIAAQLAEQKAMLDAGMEQVLAGQEELDAGRAALEEGLGQLDAAQAQLNAGLELLDEGEAQLDAAQPELDATKEMLDGVMAEINRGLADYRTGTAALDASVAEAEEELADSEQKLNDGEKEYADGVADYEKARADADRELADGLKELTDAQDEIDSLEPGKWYILGRNTLAGYVTYGSDSERMSNLADVFPIIFFLVAALACLTTMTRMVEEQRTQIGCMKALGFTRAAISVKYIGYAFCASFFGGIVGVVAGCIMIPLVIYNAWQIMYTLPDMEFLIQPGICVLAVLAAVLCTTGAALYACVSTLIDTPANLMRPRAPKAGKRVLLERIGPVWSRLSFTWKVTVRNLFRYQRRFWMTVIGIGGCTALIVTGFGLHNSIFDILTLQYDEVTPYNASIGITDDVTQEQLEAITAALDNNKNVVSYLTSYQATVDVTGSEGIVEGVNLFVVEDMESFREYVHLRHRVDGQSVELPEDGIVITEKLSELLELEIGDTITLDGEKRVDVTVGEIVENYVYHYIYLTADCYEALYGEQPVGNSIVMNLTGSENELVDQVSTELMRLKGVASFSNIAFIRDTFTDSMASIDYAVVIIILSAAALAFVVLYNLTNINITERMRELATLKVLGFYDKEVSAYVYRENIFLTVFGIALGLGMGRWLHAWLVRTVEISYVMFGRTAPPSSYLWAVVLTVVFSVVVNLTAHFSLKKIDMVESLKTVE